MVKRYLVLDYGCIECGEDTTIIGAADTIQAAGDLAITHKNHKFLIIDLLLHKVSDDRLDFE